MHRVRMRIKEGVEKGLCGSCEHGHFRTMESGRVYAMCFYYSTPTPLGGRVVECNDYSERNRPSLYDMKQTAWILEVKKGRVVGFLNPEARKAKGIRVEED